MKKISRREFIRLAAAGFGALALEPLLSACERVPPTGLPAAQSPTAAATSSPTPQPSSTSTPEPTLEPTATPTFTPQPTETPTPTATMPPPPEPVGLMDENAARTDYDGETWTVYNQNGQVTARWNPETEDWDYNPENMTRKIAVFGRAEMFGIPTIPAEMTQFMPVDPEDKQDLMFRVQDENGNLIPAPFGFVRTSGKDTANTVAEIFLLRYRGLVQGKDMGPYKNWFAVLECPISPDRSVFVLHWLTDQENSEGSAVTVDRDLTPLFAGEPLNNTIINSKVSRISQAEVLEIFRNFEVGRQLLQFYHNVKDGPQSEPVRSLKEAILSGTVPLNTTIDHDNGTIFGDDLHFFKK